MTIRILTLVLVNVSVLYEKKTVQAFALHEYADTLVSINLLIEFFSWKKCKILLSTFA